MGEYDVGSLEERGNKGETLHPVKCPFCLLDELRKGHLYYYVTDLRIAASDVDSVGS